MVATYTLNQATPLPIKGSPATGYNLNTDEGVVDPASVSSIYGATALKVVGQAGGQPLLDKAAANDLIFGFAKYNPVKNTGAMNGENITVFKNGSEVIMEVGATAVVAGNLLEIVATGDLVIPSAGTNKIIGTAKIGGATGALIPVVVNITKPAAQ